MARLRQSYVHEYEHVTLAFVLLAEYRARRLEPMARRLDASLSRRAPMQLWQLDIVGGSPDGPQLTTRPAARIR